MQSESIPNIHRASLILYILQQSELKALELGYIYIYIYYNKLPSLDDKHLGDTKIEHLCKGLFKNQTVTELDLSKLVNIHIHNNAFTKIISIICLTNLIYMIFILV